MKILLILLSTVCLLTYFHIYLKCYVYKAPECLLAPKKHNPDHKIDCLQNTCWMSAWLTVNHSWPIRDLKWQWLKIKQLIINSCLKYYFEVNICILLTHLKTPGSKKRILFQIVEFLPETRLALFLKCFADLWIFVIQGFFFCGHIIIENGKVTKALQNPWKTSV